MDLRKIIMKRAIVRYFQIAIIYIPSFEIEARDTALWSTYKYVIVSFIFGVERCVNLFIFMWGFIILSFISLVIIEGSFLYILGSLYFLGTAFQRLSHTVSRHSKLPMGQYAWNTALLITQNDNHSECCNGHSFLISLIVWNTRATCVLYVEPTVYVKSLQCCEKNLVFF